MEGHFRQPIICKEIAQEWHKVEYETSITIFKGQAINVPTYEPDILLGQKGHPGDITNKAIG